MQNKNAAQKSSNPTLLAGIVVCAHCGAKMSAFLHQRPAVLPAWISCPLPAAFSGSPLRGHRRVSHADGHAVFKVRCWFCNKKSPHNNLNLTIPSGMALVRVCYVAIRKLKTCSGSFGSRAGTLSKYVILNCWNRLPQKLSRVNRNFWKQATFGSLQEKMMETLVKREGWIARSVCNGMQTRNFSEQKNNRLLQVELENGRSFLQNDCQIWEAFWAAS